MEGWIWFLLCIPLYTTSAQQVPSVTLQADGIPTNASYLYWIGSEIPEMTEFSVCFYLRLLRARDNFDSILSYGVANSFNEILIGIGFPEQEVHVAVREPIISKTMVPIEILRWLRICLVVNFKTTSSHVYFNDDVFSETVEGYEKIRGGGELYLGQDQDELGGGFSFQQSLNAIIADFRLYNRALTEEEAKDFVNCTPISAELKPLLDFSDLASKWMLEGSMEVRQLSLADICKPEQNLLIMFPEMRFFRQSIALCDNLGGLMITPASVEENQQVWSLVTRYITQCRNPSSLVVHLGVISDSDNQSFVHYRTGDALPYNNSAIPSVMPGLPCTALDVTPGWEGAGAHRNATASFVLSVTSPASQNFLLLDSPGGGKPIFRGYFYSQVQLAGEKWTLTYLPDSTTNAIMHADSEEQYPMGFREWIVEGDKCSVHQATKVNLVFTACQEDEYTCNDGSCVHIDKRCNLLADCSDLSDELNCTTTKIPQTYIGELPPHFADGFPVPVTVLVNITSVREFSLLDLRISFDMILVFTWRDWRLTFAHLKDDLDMNRVRDDARVWKPEVFLEDGSGSRVDVEVRGGQTSVQRAAPPIPDDIARLKEDELFKGSENDLQEIRTLTVKSACQFDLAMYPFDVQACQVLIRSTLAARSIALQSQGVNFLGGRRLLEYYVHEVRTEGGEREGRTHITIFLTFYNLYKYYICGTYVPTTLLVTITYFTFYFNLEDFTNRIMVSLTALMVMAALFLQTNQAIPRTAYLKLVDIWFVFCIVTNFTIVLLLVIIDWLRENRHREKENHLNMKKVAPVKMMPFPNVKNDAFLEKKEPILSFYFRLNTWCRILFPVGFICFVLSYLVYTLTNRKA